MLHDKLTVVVRADLSSGQKIAQVLHAGLAYAQAYPSECHDWMARSNTVVVVETPQIDVLRERAAMQGIPHAAFYEPDLADTLTAVALGPGPQTRKLTRALPLAG